jgi:hypothetical protein
MAMATPATHFLDRLALVVLRPCDASPGLHFAVERVSRRFLDGPAGKVR